MLIPLGFAQCNVIFGGTAVPHGAEATFGISNGDDLSPEDIGALVLTHWATSDIMDSFSSLVTVTSVLVKLGPNEDGASALVVGSGIPGVGGAALPPNVSVLVRKGTGHGGRKGQGRMFLPGFPEGLVSEGGVVNGTQLTTLNGDLNEFMGLMDGDNIPLVLLHGVEDSPPAPYPVTSLVAQPLVATQRRRLRP